MEYYSGHDMFDKRMNKMSSKAGGSLAPFHNGAGQSMADGPLSAEQMTMLRSPLGGLDDARADYDAQF